MCGIFAAISGSEDVTEVVFEGISRLEYRGYDSWGMVTATPQLLRERAVGEVSKAKIALPAAPLAIAHTRWATHGAVAERNAHPHFDCAHEIAVIHNGVIENMVELKKQLAETHVFESETDTELIAHRIEEELKTLPFLKAFERSLHGLTGNNAIVVTNGRILACWCHGMPLVIGTNEDIIYLASDVAAFPKTVSKVAFVPEKVAVDVVAYARKATFIDRINSITTLPIAQQSTQMMTEICEQTRIIKKILENQTRLELLPLRLWKNKQWLLTGCGSAHHAALIGAQWLSQAGVDARAVVASEVDSDYKSDIVLGLSQSGETLDTLEALKRFKGKATIVSFLNNEQSSMARISDHVVGLSAGVEVAVASTKAFTAKLVWLDLLVKMIKENTDLSSNELQRTADQVEAVFSGSCLRQIRNLAHSLAQTQSMFVIGKGSFHPIALEMALKIKEIAYIHAEGLVASELKHGPLALVDEQLPVLGVAMGDELSTTQKEIEARHGQFIGISYPPTLGKDSRWLFAIIWGQVLAHELALTRGNNPDRPRNLAKSVTVS